MRLNPKIKVREMAGERVIVMQGKAGADMTKIVTLNTTAEELLNYFSDKDFEQQDVEKYLVDTYEIDAELAHKDATTWVESIKKCGLIA